MLVGVECFDLELRPRELGGPRRQHLGGQLVRRRVREISGDVDPLADTRDSARALRQTRLRPWCRGRSSRRVPPASPASSSAPGCRTRASCLRRSPAPVPRGRAGATRRAATPESRRRRRPCARQPKRRCARRLTSSSSFFPIPATTTRLAFRSPFVCRTTAVPRSPFSSPLSASCWSRPLSCPSRSRVPFEKTCPPPPWGKGIARESGSPSPGALTSIVSSPIGARSYRGAGIYGVLTKSG